VSLGGVTVVYYIIEEHVFTGGNCDTSSCGSEAGVPRSCYRRPVSLGGVTVVYCIYKNMCFQDTTVTRHHQQLHFCGRGSLGAVQESTFGKPGTYAAGLA
jgi:hypothetical protein